VDDDDTAMGFPGLDVAPGKIMASGGVRFQITSGIGEFGSTNSSFSFHLLRSCSMTCAILWSNLRFLNLSH
jgi:hypothetical protein